MHRVTTPDPLFQKLSLEDLLSPLTPSAVRADLRTRKHLKRLRSKTSRAYPTHQYLEPGGYLWQTQYSGLAPCSLSRARCTSENTMYPYLEGNPCARCQGIDIEALLSAEGYLIGSYRDLIEAAASGCGICGFVVEQVDLVRKRVTCSERGLGDADDRFDSELLSIKFGSRHKVPYCSDEVHIYVDECFAGSIALCTDAGDPASKIIPGRRAVLRPNIQYITQLIQDWNYNFLDQVDSQINRPRELPTRVINIHSPIIHLEDFSQLSNEERPKDLYVTLSHRWDESRELLRTTTQTLSDFKTHINIERLPLGFRDAIDLARRLGIRYIWIDSLCIIQDSRADWEEESAKMGSYYGSSWLNIAMGLASHVGCFPPREVSIEKIYLKCQTLENDGSTLYFGTFEPDENLNFDGASILQDRAWTFQEEILSPRSVTFAKDQIFYHCDTYLVSERGIQTEFAAHQFSRAAPLTKIELFEDRWERMVEIYFTRKLTKSADRLPALSGIAHTYQSIWKDEYVAGCWRQYLLWQLCWYRHTYIRIDDEPETHHPAFTYRAPSWSWAAKEGRPDEILTFWHKENRSESLLRVELLHVSIDLASADPMGSVKEGVLILSGLMTKTHLDTDPGLLRADENDERIPYYSDPMPSALQPGREIWLLGITEYAALVLMAVPVSDPGWMENTYERVGFAIFSTPAQIESPAKQVVRII